MINSISNTIKNGTIELEVLLKGIENKQYIIPEFQRNFVWSRNDIVNLADSIIREYPISSILLMKAGGNLKIPGKTLAFNKKFIGNEDIEGFYVLDGQQRLTALTEIFIGISDKDYYFDLLTILYELFPEDNILNYSFYNTKRKEKAEKFIYLIENNNQFNGIDNLFCRTFSKSNDETLSKGNHRYLSAKAVYKNNFVFTISNFLNNIVDLTNDKKQIYMNVLNALFSKINRYRIATTEISENADLGLVIRIFEKINSSGIKLSLFDLINAKTFAISNEGLGKFLTHEIRQYLQKNELKISLFDKIFEYSEKEHIYLNLGRIIRILEMISLLEKEEVVSAFSNSKMLNKEPNFWFEQWKTYKEKILEFMQYFANEKVIGFISLAGLEYFCAIFSFYYPKDKKIFLNIIKKVLLSANFKETGFNKSNISLFKDFIDFAKYLQNTNNYNFYKYNNEYYLKIQKYLKNNIDDINDIINITSTPKNYKFKTLMYFIYKENLKGSGIIDLEGYKLKNDFFNKDYHHIFPLSKSKNFSKNLQNLFNSVVNVALLDSYSNRYSIKDQNFEVYMNEILNLFGEEKFDEILKSNLLDKNLVMEYIKNPSENLIKNILEKRAEKMLEIVQFYFNN